MPQFSRALDVYQGFNFKKDKQSSVGFLTKLTLGESVELAADQVSIKDPVQPDQSIAGVVGVISHFMWETGYTDGMYVSAQISTSNKQVLSSALLGNWSNTDVKFNVIVFEYDPVKKQYFKSLWADADLEGILEKNGEDLNLTVADEPSTEVQSPKNFTLQIGIKPQTKEQAVNLATANGKNLVKQWGVTEEAAA